MDKKRTIIAVILLVIVLAVFSVLFGLRPLNTNAAPMLFEIKQGEGFRSVIASLASDGLIRSSAATTAFAVLDGSAFRLQPGLYKLNAAMGAVDILRALSQATGEEVSVTIPEGSNLYQVDSILSNALVLRPGEIINFHDDGPLEGRLFPDTYRFYTGSNVTSVVQKFLDNFSKKAQPLLAADPKNATSDLIMASIVDKEVPDLADQEIVAGVLIKRLRAGMALQVDASVCYGKLLVNPGITGAGTVPSCYPLSPLDFKLDSPYNTYLYKGLPPAPIGNPGIAALQAVLHPKTSPYWFYLSDPKTGQTIFAKTLDEQAQNKVKYLNNR